MMAYLSIYQFIYLFICLLIVSIKLILAILLPHFQTPLLFVSCCTSTTGICWIRTHRTFHSQTPSWLSQSHTSPQQCPPPTQNATTSRSFKYTQRLCLCLLVCVCVCVWWNAIDLPLPNFLTIAILLFIFLFSTRLVDFHVLISIEPIMWMCIRSRRGPRRTWSSCCPRWFQRTTSLFSNSMWIQTGHFPWTHHCCVIPGLVDAGGDCAAVAIANDAYAFAQLFLPSAVLMLFLIVSIIVCRLLFDFIMSGLSDEIF